MHEIRWNVTRSYLPNDFSLFYTKRYCNASGEEKNSLFTNENIYFSHMVFSFFLFSGMKFEAFSEWKSELGSLSMFHVYQNVYLVGVCCANIFRTSAWALIRTFGMTIAKKTYVHILSSACQICCRLNYWIQECARVLRVQIKLDAFCMLCQRRWVPFELPKIFAQFLCWKWNDSSS